MRMQWMLKFCCLAHSHIFLIVVSLLAYMAAGSKAMAAGPSPEFLVEGGKARAVIVLGDNAVPS